MKVRLSREAVDDIDEIEDFTAARWGNAQADLYIRGLHAAAARLAAHPQIGTRRARLPQPYLAYTSGSHVFVYRADKDLDELRVLRILHVKMDLARRIRETLHRAR